MGEPAWSSLTLRLSNLLARLHLAADDEALRAKVQQAVSRNFPRGQTPSWLDEMLDSVLEPRLTGRCVRFPAGSPEGEEHFSNVLSALESEIALGFDDPGEWLFWPMPALNVALLIEREGGNYYVVRPLDGPWEEHRVDGAVGKGQLRGGRAVGRWRYTKKNGDLLYEYDHDGQGRK
jgi:hypothetical protein